MPSTRKTTTTVQRELNEDDELIQALNGIGATDAIIKLFKYEHYPSKAAYIDDVDIGVIESGRLEHYLKEKHGPGSYQCRAMIAGRWVKGGSRVLHIAGDNAAVVVHSKNGNSNGDGVDWKMILTLQQQSSDRMMQMMATMNTSMMAAISTVVAGSKGPDLAGMAAIMNTFKPAGDPLDTVTKIVDLTAKLQGGGGGGDSEPDPMTALLGTGLKLLESRAAAGAVAAPTVHNPPAAAVPVQPTTAKEGHQVEQADPELSARLEFLRMLKRKAILGKDPEEWADYIESNQDDAVCVWLLVHVRKYEWNFIRTALAQTDPELGQEPCASWFQKLHEILTGEDDGAGELHPAT